eukprot:7568945-Heterocapsa_arctica.AAC.1
MQAIPRLLESRPCRAWPAGAGEGFAEVPVDRANDGGMLWLEPVLVYQCERPDSPGGREAVGFLDGEGRRGC